MNSKPDAQTRRFGLALSGGGSRAAAFHRGTLQGLLDLQLVDRLDVISTVSGGSVFGAAWMAARLDGSTDKVFLNDIRKELQKGFVLRSLAPRLLKTLVPGLRYSRTNVIAQTFDEVFFHGRKLAELPDRPGLCINTTILNNGRVGKFSRYGFSAWDLYSPDSKPHHQISMPDFLISKAVAASAAFPVGLPPIELRREEFPSAVEFRGSLEGARALALTDGGVLENLGLQTLLKSERFGTWDMVISDAGTAGKSWNPGSVLNPFRSFGVWILSGRILDRIMLVMNDKQNRWAREQVFGEQRFSWTGDALRQKKSGPGLAVLLDEAEPFSRRNVLFLSVAQDWNGFMLGIPKYRLKELESESNPVSDPLDPAKIERFLERAGVSLSVARRYYSDLGGDAGVKQVNRVATNFTSLGERTLDQLAAHAAWQLHAAQAVYGFGGTC